MSSEMGGRGESTVVNYGNKVPTLDAAFVNATFGQGCELDDVGFAAGGHPGAATVPVALAVGERQRSNGKDFLAAVVVGCDVMYRCSRRCVLPPVSEVFIATGSARLSERWRLRQDCCA